MKLQDIVSLFMRKQKSALENSLAAYQKQRGTSTKFAICHAPFKNLYFGHRGVVTACCYNRLYELGTWPQSTIKQIWEGEKANSLRAHLKQNSLLKGCSVCELQLSAGNFSGFKAAQFDGDTLNENGYPSVFEFELDNTCNLECVMCSAEYSSSIANRNGTKVYTSPYDNKFVGELAEFIPYLKQAKFYGGEPFMIKLYYEIWDAIGNLNSDCNIIIQTNGTILNTRIKDLLEKCNFSINISLDSLNKENYERIRVNASFETVISNLQYFYEYAKRKKSFFGLSACIMKQNWHEAPDFVNFCNERNIKLYFHTVLSPRSASLSFLDKHELESIISTLKAVTFKEPGTDQQKENINHYHQFIKQLMQWSTNQPDNDSGLNNANPENWEQLFLLVRDVAKKKYGKEKGEEKAAYFETNLKEIAIELGIDNENDFPRSINIQSFSMEFENIAGLSKSTLKKMIEKHPMH
jgi:MoaA/NifB/PqqE/SkfB family radical SAM enzyme